MLPDYKDIKDKIQEEPQWYDDNGVPRYCKFHPKCCGVYDREVILLKIACQDCKEIFYVSMSAIGLSYDGKATLFSDMLQQKKSDIFPAVHYGDPPRHYCGAGDTMNCIDLQIVEFWKKDNFDWKRMPEYEIELEKIEDYSR